MRDLSRAAGLHNSNAAIFLNSSNDETQRRAAYSNDKLRRWKNLICFFFFFFLGLRRDGRAPRRRLGLGRRGRVLHVQPHRRRHNVQLSGFHAPAEGSFRGNRGQRGGGQLAADWILPHGW